MKRDTSMKIDARDHPGLTTFQRVLLTTDGSVSELLALHARRPIAAQVLEQELVSGEQAELIGCTGDEQMLRRVVLLGCPGEAAFIHAESRFNFSLFSPAIQHALLHTGTPIGLLWRRERLEMYREVVEARVEFGAPAAALLSAAPDEPLYSRAYNVQHRGRMLGLITERFRAGSLT